MNEERNPSAGTDMLWCVECMCATTVREIMWSFDCISTQQMCHHIAKLNELYVLGIYIYEIKGMPFKAQKKPRRVQSHFGERIRSIYTFCGSAYGTGFWAWPYLFIIRTYRRQHKQQNVYDRVLSCQSPDSRYDSRRLLILFFLAKHN